jgi:hypothetical protein
MLSPQIEWIDVDPVQWHNMWRLLYGPQRQPVYLYGVLEQGSPVALVHSSQGQLDLSLWPRDADSLRDVAVLLRERTHVDQAIVLERQAVHDLWDVQQRAWQPGDDLAAFVDRMRTLTARLLDERAACDPPGAQLSAYPPVQYAALLDLLQQSVGASGTFVLGIYEGDALWFSLAGQMAEGQIVLLTTSLGLTDPGTVPVRQTREKAYRWLLDACARRLGPPSLGLFLDIEVARILPFSVEPARVLREGVERGLVLIEPRPAALYSAVERMDED